MSTQKKIMRCEKATKVTFFHDKISMSMSSTDKHIPGMLCQLTYVNVHICTRSSCVLNVFLFYKYIFLQSIARIVCILLNHSNTVDMAVCQNALSKEKTLKHGM